MCEICFLVSIRQVTCQNGVPVVNEKTYTNVSPSDTILLNNGYTLILSANTSDSITLNFSNPAFNLDFKIVTANETPVVVDLPIEGGTFRVGIFVQRRLCNTCECCC